MTITAPVRRPWAPPPMNGYRPMIVNVALTGAVPTKVDNPNVPLTPEEIAAEALACARAGASVVHVHVRDESGQPVHRRDLYERAFAPIRDEMPELILCVTTSSRVDPDPEARLVGLELDPPLRPDLASLTLGSFNFPRSVSNNPPATSSAWSTRSTRSPSGASSPIHRSPGRGTVHAVGRSGGPARPRHASDRAPRRRAVP